MKMYACNVWLLSLKRPNETWRDLADQRARAFNLIREYNTG